MPNEAEPTDCVIAYRRRPWQWVVTGTNPASPATGYDAGRRGWKQHAVRAGNEERVADIAARAAACGLVPKHGWDLDLFSHSFDKCRFCLKEVSRGEKA